MTSIKATCSAFSSTGDAGAVAASMAARMRDAAISGGAAAPPLRQGWLLMADDSGRPGSQARREWRRRFFVLDVAGTLSYHDSKVGAMLCRPAFDRVQFFVTLGFS